MHQDVLPHLRVFSTLMEKFATDSRTVEKLKEYLLVVCTLCGKLTENKLKRDEHETTCLPRQISLCLYYGEAYSRDLFESKFIEERKAEYIGNHLINQLNLLADDLRECDFETAEKSAATVQLSAKKEQLTFRKVLNEETESDLLMPTSSLQLDKNSDADVRSAPLPDNQETNVTKSVERGTQRSIVRYMLAKNTKKKETESDKKEEEEEEEEEEVEERTWQ